MDRKRRIRRRNRVESLGLKVWEDGKVLTLASDKKCPFTGLVSIRGRILTGTVVSTKMHRTVIIRREYLHFIPKYSRYEKRHKNLAAHVSPAFRVEEGDQVTVGQCRPLSKTVRCENLEKGKVGRSGMLTYDFYIGPLQRPARAAPYRQGDQEVQQVLNGKKRRTSSGHFWRVKQTSGGEDRSFPTGGSGTGSYFANDCIPQSRIKRKIHEAMDMHGV